MNIKKLPLTKKEQEKYATLVENEVKRLERKKDVFSILIGGSFARNELTKGSDIDFILITKTGDSPIEERKTIEDIPVEWFSISEKAANTALKEEAKSVNRFISGVLADCKFVSGDKKVAEQIIKSAQKTLKSKVPPLSKEERTGLLFFLGRSPEQEIRLQERNQNVATSLRMNHKLFTCFELAHRLEGQALPSYKSWDDNLPHLKDRKMAKLLKNAAYPSKPDIKFKHWSALVRYTKQQLEDS